MLITLLLACEEPTKTNCDACSGQCLVEHQPSAGADHVEGDLDYPDPPPTSGIHNGCWASWGPHAEAVPPENFIHNLEHGGIVLLYACDDCPDEVNQLAAFGAGLEPGRWLLSPYTESELALPYVALAWEERLSLGCVDLVQLQDFYDTHVGTGPEDLTIEPPSSCLDGTGTAGM